MAMRKGEGRRNPPEQSRFKPGQSGNPKGRPKGSRNLSTIAKEVLRKPVEITEKNGKTVKKTSLEVMLLRATHDGIKGNAKARADMLRLARDLEMGTAQNNQEVNPGTQADDGFAPDPKILRMILKRFKHLEGEGNDE